MMIKPKMGVVFTSIEGVDVDQDRLTGFKNIFKKNIDSACLDNHYIDFIVSDIGAADHANKLIAEKNLDLLCIVIVIWTPDTTVIRLIEGLDIPVILFTTTLSPYTIGLNGAQLVAASMKELEKDYRFIFGDVAETETIRKIYDFAMASCLMKKLRKLKIGVIGGRLSIMTDLTVDEFGLKKVFGTTVVPIDFAAMQDYVDNIDESKIRDRMAEIKKSVKNITVDESTLSESIRYYFAFIDIVKQYQLDAIAVNCYPYPYIKAKTCLALSNMNDRGIPAACESDVSASILMYMLQSINGKSALNSDLIYEDTGSNSIMFSHCGCGPFSCAESIEDIRLEEHFEVKSGMAVYYPLKEPDKNTTIVNLVGRENTFRLCALSGRTIPTRELLYKGNPVTVKFKTDVVELVNIIGNEGYGHHWMVSLGDHSGIFKEFCNLVKIHGLFIQ